MDKIVRPEIAKNQELLLDIMLEKRNNDNLTKYKHIKIHYLV